MLMEIESCQGSSTVHSFRNILKIQTAMDVTSDASSEFDISIL